MKLLLRKIIFFTLYHMGLGTLFRRYNDKQKKIPVLLFHRVSDDKDEFWEPFSVDLFSRLLHFLSKRYDFIVIDELLQQEKINLENRCLITFDDGYDDFVRNALPIMEKLKIKPTFFVTTGSISKNEIIWTSELNKAIDHTLVESVSIEEDDFNKTLLLTTKHKKLESANVLLNYLKRQTNEKRIEVLKKIKKQLNYTKPLNQNMLTWDELNLIKDRVDIQSHSVTHPMVTKLNKLELQNELTASKNIIEENLNIQVKYFSYPIGDCNDDVVTVTKKYYDAAFAVGDELLDTKKVNDPSYRFQLPRINITDQSIYEVYFRINGFHSLLRKKK